jgi:hypothetical protein
VTPIIVNGKLEKTRSCCCAEGDTVQQASGACGSVARSLRAGWVVLTASYELGFVTATMNASGRFWQ